MLDFKSAQELLANHGKQIEQTEVVKLLDLNNRILATDIVANLNIPPANNSSMDGYAVRAEDAEIGQGLTIQDCVYAGQKPVDLQTGKAIRIFTGAFLPTGADAVIMQENCTVQAGKIIINSAVSSGDNIRYCGEDMANGAVLLTKGTKIKSSHIAMLAAQGINQIQVFRRLKVGILSTGDELTQPGEILSDTTIYDSNSSMLASLCLNLGTDLPIIKHVKDDLSAIENAITKLNQECDLVLTVGGVSVGDKDFIKPALNNLGASLDLWRVAMKPGKPVALANLNGKTLVGLPGNPVSAFVVFALLLSPLIRRLQGMQHIYPPVQRGIIKLAKPIITESRMDFIRVKSDYQPIGLAHLYPHYIQNSAAISSLVFSDGVAQLPVMAKIENDVELNWYSWSHWLV